MSGVPAIGATASKADNVLVVCDDDDSAGPWISRQLSHLTTRSVQYLTATDLTRGNLVLLQHGRTASAAIWTRNTSISVDRCTPIMNRLGRIPPQTTEAVTSSDRSYTLNEWYALIMGLLSISERVVNPPKPPSLSSANRALEEWRVLAKRCGIPIALDCQPSIGHAPKSFVVADIVVVGESVFSTEDIPDHLTDQLRLLLRRSGEHMFGVKLAWNSSAWRFLSVGRNPNLQRFGTGPVRAIAELLRL